MAKDAYYFSHDSNARNDPKTMMMRSVYGSEGYGWYWMLIEIMRDQSDYELDMRSQYACNAFALDLHCKPDTIRQFIDDCANEFGLFEEKDGKVWSNSLKRRMAIKEEKSKKARAAAHARWENEAQSEDDADALPTDSDSNANKEKEKESETKSNENKPRYTAFAELYISRFNELFKTNARVTDSRVKKLKTRLKTYSTDEIMKALDHLSKSAWHQGKNDSNWKADADFLIKTDEQVDKWLNKDGQALPHSTNSNAPQYEVYRGRVVVD